VLSKIITSISSLRAGILLSVPQKENIRMNANQNKNNSQNRNNDQNSINNENKNRYQQTRDKLNEKKNDQQKNDQNYCR